MSCIVSAYFKIPSKQPHEWYLPYLVRFFKGICKENLVFFTSIDVLEELKLLVDLNGVKFIIMHFSNIVAFKKYGYDFWKKQFDIDPEKYHSPELAAIWYEKKEFVLKASQYVKSDVYIWCDAGCVRDDISSYFLRDFGGRRCDLNNNKIHLQLMSVPEKREFYSYPNVYIACAIIAGNIEAWGKYKISYDNMLSKYNENGICGSSDQHVTGSCVDTAQDMFVLYDKKTRCDEWFKFLELL